MRTKPGAHVSKDGIALAQYASSTMGQFSRVVTSEIPRAIETAVAMGYEVNETLAFIGELPQDVFEEVGWPNRFERISEIVKHSAILKNYSSALAQGMTDIVSKIPESTSALVISHGCIIESAAIGCLPNASHSEWGDAIGYCEGIRFSFDSKFTDCTLLRMPDKYHLIEN